MAAEAASTTSAGNGQELPVIRRLKVCLLGGDSFVKSIGKTDVAASLLWGLTCEQPDEGADPILELAFDCGVFERAWRELIVPPVDGEVTCSQWGTGPVAAWEGRLSFDHPGSPAEAAQAKSEAESSTESAVLCAGTPERLGLTLKRSASAVQAFKEAITAAGHSVETFEEMHKEMYAAAESNPRELVRKERSAPGLLASFSRFSPEVGDFSGCGGVVLHIFEPGLLGYSRSQGVAMMCAAAPNGRRHTGLSPRTFLCALRASGSNIIRTVREYNRLVLRKPPPERWERSVWYQADLRAEVESFLCDKNLRTDVNVQQKIAEDEDGWLDLELVKGERKDKILDAELLDALSSSRCVETKVSEDGTILIRRIGGKAPPPLDGTDLNLNKRRRVHTPPAPNPARDLDPTCWDWLRRGFCPRGDTCKYLHSTDAGAVQAAQTGMVEAAASAAGEAGGRPAVVAPPAGPAVVAPTGTSAEAAALSLGDNRSPADMESDLRRALGLSMDGDGGLPPLPRKPMVWKSVVPAPEVAEDVAMEAEPVATAAAGEVAVPAEATETTPLVAEGANEPAAAVQEAAIVQPAAGEAVASVSQVEAAAEGSPAASTEAVVDGASVVAASEAAPGVSS